MPKQVQTIAANALRPGYAYVDCVGEEDSATNLQVKQWLTMAPLDDHLHLLVQLVTSHQAAVPDHKIICFFPTARATQLAAELFVALGRPVTEIHSRKSQGHRTKAADAFRESKSGVMMSSDVSARGLDYPDVTLVVQVGLPSSREQYIHRLGRTARAGKTGEGLLLLAPHEEFFTRQLRDLPITNAPAQIAVILSMAALGTIVGIVGLFLLIPTLLGAEMLRPAFMAILLAAQAGIYALALGGVAGMLQRRRDQLIETLRTKQ